MNGKPAEPKRNGSLMLVIGIALLATVVMAAVAGSRTSTQPKPVAFSVFLDQLSDDKVQKVLVNSKSQALLAELKSGKLERANIPPDYQLTQRLEYEKVPFDVTTSSPNNGNWLLLFGAIGVIVLLVLLSRSRQSTAKASAGSPGRMIEAGDIQVTFKDVAGCDEVVAELQEIREFLSDPERFRKLGASIPKGVLLFGPPGTGKTLLARAVAGEAGVPFYSISGSDFVEMYVGVGASRVRKLFESAKQHAPCVIFIDEIDAVGRRRSGNAQGGQEERENTLNQLLVEIDGFAPNDNVIVMAASNRADILDPALTRPGRFDRQVIVDTPDRAGRRDILAVHGTGKPFATSIDLDTVAAQTAGFCGADLANLVNEAALLAARNDRSEIIGADMEEAMMRVIAGPQKTRLLTDTEKRTIAAHEIGHAIVANDVPDAEPVHKVTIVSRGRALGLMVSLSEQDKVLRTRQELMGDMAVALGGRVAEEIMFDDITTGASNDLEKVNQIAQAMVLHYGMSDQFALRSYIHEDHLLVHSDDLKDKIDSEIDAIVGEAKLRAQTILLARRDELARLTDVLIERETIDRADFEQLMRGEDLAPLVVEGSDAPADADGEQDAAMANRPDADAWSGAVDASREESVVDAGAGARRLQLVSDPAPEDDGADTTDDGGEDTTSHDAAAA